MTAGEVIAASPPQPARQGFVGGGGGVWKVVRTRRVRLLSSEQEAKRAVYASS